MGPKISLPAASHEVRSDAFTLRDQGDRPKGKKRRSRQVVLRMNAEEVETLEFFRQHLGLNYGQAVKTAAILGSQALGYAVLLARLDYAEDSGVKFLHHLTQVSQRSAGVFGRLMQETYDKAVADLKKVSK